MSVGFNKRFIVHCFICRQYLTRTSKLFILSVLLTVLIFSFPATGGLVSSDDATNRTPFASNVRANPALAPIPGNVLAPIEAILDRFKVEKTYRDRVARSILRSSWKHDVDPRLVTSIMMVESRANPFAISGSDAIGLMQIHLPTWGSKAEREGINLFKIEDNVDFGVRILKDYIRRYGIWGGVKRYKGWYDNPTSEQNANEYVQKVQRIYGD
jgi:hypothetical protein